jgi:serine/threonine-protein kinase GIN4
MTFFLVAQQRKRVPVPVIVDLPPIKGSPVSSPLTFPAGKENMMPLNAIPNSPGAARKPFGTITGRDNIPRPPMRLMPNSPEQGGKDKERRRSRALADLTGNNVDKVKEGKGKVKDKEGGKDHVRERVRDWERERLRLREMTRLEEIEIERDEEIEEEGGKEMAEWKGRMADTRETEKERVSDKENHRVTQSPPVTSPTASTFMTGAYFYPWWKYLPMLIMLP